MLRFRGLHCIVGLPIHRPGIARWVQRKSQHCFGAHKTLALNSEAGSTLIEFVYVLMILLMLTFGMIDLGRAIYAANVVAAAAQSGARAGIIDLAAVTPAVQNRLTGLDPAKAQITATLVSNERVEVEVLYRFELLTPFLSRVVNDGVINLSGRATMLNH